MSRKNLLEDVGYSSTGPRGVDFWRLSEPTWYYILGLLALQIVGREIFRRKGPFKDDAALFVHQVCSILCILHCGGWGIYYWLTEAGQVEDRLYEQTEGAVFIGKVNLAFQFYDLLATYFIEKLRKPEMLVHHTLSTLMCYFLLRDCYVHYYAIFFLGISEVSSIPLSIVDIFKFFPNVAAMFPTLNAALRMTFALMFILLRVIYWPLIAGRHILDTVRSIQAGTVHSVGVVAFFTACNLTMTLLQFYWGYLILRAVVKMLTAKKETESDPSAAKEKSS